MEIPQKPKMAAGCLLKYVILLLILDKALGDGLGLDSPAAAAGASSSYPHRLVSGVYKELLPPPIYYDTFIPIVYEYQLPEWNKSEVTFNNWYTCLSETTPYKYTCPTVFHMNKAVLNLHIDFESLQPVQDRSPHSDWFDGLYRTSGFCDTIQKHFSGVYIQDKELDTYLEMLGRCRWGEYGGVSLGHIERAIPDYNYTLRAPFSKMENNYYNTYYKPMNANNSGLDLVASATLSNARTTIQATLLNVYYAEKYRWVHALQDCQKQLLPHSLVTLKKLNETLREMEAKPGFEYSYKFAIGLDLLSKYYSLPLTDCTYTANSFVVRILLPVQLKTSKTESSLAFYGLRAVPFHYEHKFCHVELGQEQEQRLVHDSANNVTYVAACESNTLCLTTEFSQPSNIDYCAWGIITENFTATKDNCDFECKDAPQALLDDGIVTRVASDTFVVTFGSNNSKIGLECSNGQQWQLGAVESGAVQVRLPCKCRIVAGTRAHHVEHPCSETSSAKETVQIEPWHLHYSDSMDNDSSTDPAMRQYFLVKKMIYLQQLNDPASLDHLHEDDFMGNGIGVEGGAGAGSAAHAHQIGGDESSSRNGDGADSHAILWTFFAISVITLLILQVYIIYQLRFVKIQSGSPTLLQSMLFNVRGTRSQDQEPEFRLLNNEQ